MQEAKKNVILRVFRTAHCPPGKYFFGVTCSALSVLLSGVPFYTVYRIIRLFLLASLDGAAAPTHEIWMWAAVTIGSIVLGIVLSVIGSFSCHACAFNALYDLAYAPPRPHGTAKPRLLHRRSIRRNAEDDE